MVLHSFGKAAQEVDVILVFPGQRKLQAQSLRDYLLVVCDP